MDHDTIFAIASGAGRAAIAVLRLSGPATRVIVKSIAGKLPNPRSAALATFRDPATGEAIDKGLVLFSPDRRVLPARIMRNSHVHGGRAVVAAMVKALSGCGARPAEPGEFTRRAFVNGKMDLAEGRRPRQISSTPKPSGSAAPPCVSRQACSDAKPRSGGAHCLRRRHCSPPRLISLRRKMCRAHPAGEFVKFSRRFLPG